MNMEDDRFEHWLKEQPIRRLPPSWQEVVVPNKDDKRILGRHSAWRWAWGTIAACWLLILGLHVVSVPSSVSLTTEEDVDVEDTVSPGGDAAETTYKMAMAVFQDRRLTSHSFNQ